MVWKPKEQELTPEEAIALASAELKPYWIGSEPLLAGVVNGATAAVHPLRADFSEKNWLLFFLDRHSHVGTSALHAAREWYRRYSSNGLSFLVFLREGYKELSDATVIEESLIRPMQLGFPVAIDKSGALAAAFRAEILPKVLLLSGRKTLFERDGPDWGKGAELEIQRFLRVADPGLPLLRAADFAALSRVDHSAVEFGRGRSPEVRFAGVERSREQNNERSRDQDKGALSEIGVRLNGKWEQVEEKAWSADRNATVSFKSPTTVVSLVARATRRVQAPPRIVVEVNGIPPFEVFAGSDLDLGDEGGAVLRVSTGRLYDALVRLTATDRNIVLRFPDTDEVPIELYGLRFGE